MRDGDRGASLTAGRGVVTDAEGLHGRKASAQAMPGKEHNKQSEVEVVTSNDPMEI